MQSLLIDVLKSLFVDPFVDYFYHGLTLWRVATRLLSGIALIAGIYLALLQPAPLSYVGWLLAVPASLFVLYDTLTVNQHTRD
ncbi:hypothetical protein [Haladaptatus sp. DJG-WS-42]|uniref:hypothetical protein n=1 Tax=Haladaptatus sp. DJG-WS-42 TaxID=3120516 RepID=UPI0030CC7873